MKRDYIGKRKRGLKPMEFQSRRNRLWTFLLSTIISGILYDVIKNKTISIKDCLKEFFHTDDDIEDIAADINAKLQYVRQYQEIFNYIINSQELLDFAKNNDPYKTEFSKRLDYILTMVNMSNAFHGKKYDGQRLARDMGLNSYNEIKKYYIENEEPDFTFIDRVAEFIGCNKEWLATGEGEPFKSDIEYEFNPYALSSYIDEIIDEVIVLYVLISDEADPNLTFVFKFNDLKYKSYPSYYPLSGCIGASGKRQIFNLYRLMKEIPRSQIIRTIKIEKEVMDDIILGKKYPGVVTDNKYKNMPCYWDDFKDFAFRTPKEYQQWYGEEFVICQNIVKGFLDEE